MKRYIILFVSLFLTAIILGGCGGSSGSSSDGSTDGSQDTTQTTQPASIQLSASKFSVETTGSDQSTLTITAKNAQNGALEGAQISLTSTAGLLSEGLVTTGIDGKATAVFSADAEKTNQVVTITASSGAVSANLPIAITGTTAELSAVKTTVLLDQTTILTGEARDANGTPLFAKTLVLSSAKGNFLSGFDQNGTPISGTSITLTTDINGQISAEFAADVTGTDTLSLEGLGTLDTIDIVVPPPGTSFSFILPEDNTVLPVNGTVDLVVEWLDATGTPVTGEPLSFAASAGGFGGVPSATVVTDGSGQGTITYSATNNAAPATISVSNIDNTFQDTLTLDVRSISPTRLDLQASPTVVPASGGGVTSTAVLTATVRDDTNNAVAGVTVNFSLLAGPGGGEFILPVIAETDAAGQATSVFTSGGSTSAQNGVTVRASVVGAPAILDETNLTIGQQAASITFGTSNKINIVTSGGLEIGYALPVTVLVTDTNGNPIVNQNVNLGLYPLRFRTGDWFDPTINNSAINITGEFGNEDANRNGILDGGEDGSTGYDGINGKLDPGNIAQIPGQVVTDANGFAAFNITYAKSYAVWVDAELQATTVVSGSEAKASIAITLQRQDGDIPLIDSPFGL